MKAAEQALAPDFFRNFQKKAKKDIKKPKKGDDEILLQLAESEGWELVKSMIEDMSKSIDKQSKKAMGKASSWEETGKIYFAQEVSKDSIQSILDIVDLRKKANEAELDRE